MGFVGCSGLGLVAGASEGVGEGREAFVRTFRLGGCAHHHGGGLLDGWSVRGRGVFEHRLRCGTKSFTRTTTEAGVV